MLNGLTLDELTKKIPKFPIQFSKIYLSNALAGEVGEVCNLVKKELRDSKDIITELSYELADCLIYILLFADYINLDLEAVVLDKIQIVNERMEATKNDG